MTHGCYNGGDKAKVVQPSQVGEGRETGWQKKGKVIKKRRLKK